MPVRRIVSVVLDTIEIAAHAIGLAVCWSAALWLLHYGEAAWAEAALSTVPRTVAGVAALAAMPDTPARIGALALAVPSLVAAAILGFSAADGTWWLGRRLAR